MDAAHLRDRAIQFGIFEVDLRSGELRKRGVKVKLQEQPLQVLEILLEKPGEWSPGKNCGNGSGKQTPLLILITA